MGTSQSIPSTSEIKDAPRSSNAEEFSTCTKNGPKYLSENGVASAEEPNLISTDEEDGHDVSSDTDSSDDEDDDYDSEDEEDEELMERRMILQDARKLRVMAEFYLCPEKPVAVDATACARSFFSRYSAPEQTSLEEEEERSLALVDAAKLKKMAVDYLHPERPVVCEDPAACARNYFERASGPVPEEDAEDMEEEYKSIMKDMKQLKTVAEWYLQPEKPVVSDGFATGRNFFTRPSAPEYENEEKEERELIMEDMKQLKTVAQWYLQPEKPVETDGFACGRNYFSRPSAPEFDDDEDNIKEQERIMEDMKQLKTMAEWYLQPEKPVAVDSTACGRNYFTRASAPEYEEEDSAELDLILADAAKLKQVAEWYLHPEKPVAVDSTACGRNYFTRASAPAYEDDDSAAEHDLILEEAAKLKQVAEWYLHPEKPITVDAIACARNYFSRPSAPEYEDEEDMDERDCVLAEAAELKKVADWYLHPEKPIVCDDPCASGRNYFSRLSAPEYEDEEDMDERDCVLAEAAELKKVADWYLHPEKPVVCNDPCATGRNYFTRASAPEYEDENDMDEHEHLLADAMELKKYADWYLHPEKPVVCNDPCATGRNYFTRASAPEYDEDEEERQLVLAEAKKLKEVAEWYYHPEKPVVSDGFSSGRNYFTRPSAPQDDSDAEEREQILAEAKKLKKIAEWYHCPEKPVEVDPTACARNFFSRPSAPEYEDEDTMEEMNLALADAKKLKEIAGWYHHPETPVTSSIAVTRNYFTRPSAEGNESPEEEEERARVLADAMLLKKLAIDYMHPENPVVSNVNCVRNYFDRASAEGHSDYIHTEGHAIGHDYGHLQEYHHDDYYHHNDYYHHDDDHSHHTQSDHFEMDEDVREVIHGFRESLVAVQEHMAPIIKEGDEKEGNLSRSPSCVMLFDEAAM